MPNKKKKYNARFPPARIKKIMQTDEDVGKVAAAVPVIISRALELFIESLIMKASQTTQTRHAKTLTTAHIKQTIEAEKKFDFLRDLVVNIADHQTEEESEGNSYPLSEPGGKKIPRTTTLGASSSRGPRKRKDSLTTTTSPSSDGNNIRRSKHLEEEEDDEDEDNSNNNNNNNDDDDNNEETDEADSEEEEEEDQHSHGYQNQNNNPEDVEATTSSFLRGDEEKTVPSSNGFTPTTSASPKCHTLGQPTQQQPSPAKTDSGLAPPAPQFKVPALFSTTPLSKLFLPPGHSQEQQEDDDYDT